MKIYCINLDRRGDRMAHMALQFSALGLSYQRIVAVDGQDAAVALAARACPPGITGRVMSPGAFGCFQSHRQAWRQLCDSGDSHAMVLEDDLLLAPGLEVYLDPAWVPKDADFVRLETTLNRVHCDRHAQAEVAGRRLYRLHGRHSGTGGYVISQATARHLLSVTERVSDAVDEALFNPASPLFSTLITYQMDPAPIRQGARKGLSVAGWSVSSITERFADGEPDEVRAQEGSVVRFLRRLREETIARISGTRYVVVAFG